MQAAVGGGYIEALPIHESKHNFSVYIHDEGRVLEQPINMSACLWLMRREAWPAMQEPIHGEVLVLGPTNDEGEATDLSQEIIDTIPVLWQEPKFEITSL